MVRGSTSSNDVIRTGDDFGAFFVSNHGLQRSYLYGCPDFSNIVRWGFTKRDFCWSPCFALTVFFGGGGLFGGGKHEKSIGNRME